MEIRYINAVDNIHQDFGNEMSIEMNTKRNSVGNSKALNRKLKHDR